MAEDTFEVLLVYKGIECFCKKIVSKILIFDKHSILVIYYLSWLATIELKRFLVSIYCHLCGKRRLTDIYILPATAIQNHCKKVNFYSSSIFVAHPTLTKVCLCVFPIRCFFSPFILSY